MGEPDHAAVGSHLRLLFEAGTVTGVSDGHLLEMFASRRDELAFTALVERHGPMVRRVCQAVLGDHHEAQDAFQATFLVLARSAGSIRRRDSLASWLHGVALRVAARARSASARRRELERNWAALRAVETQGGTESPDDLEALVHEEIGRLPERFRAPVVLCYLEGRTYEEAAQVLLCPVGTIKSRLATARDRLRRRLERRNLPMSSGSVGLALQGGLPMTTVPAPLPAPTLQAILRNANGGPTPASISHLTNGVLETMLWHRLFDRLGVAAAILIGTASLATGAIGLARRNRDVPADGEQQAAALAPVVAQPNMTTIEPAPEDPLPAGAILRFGSPRYRQPTPIRSLAMSPDGKVAVTHGEFGVDSALRVYDLATGRAIRIIDTGRDGLGVAVSPDGKTLATIQYLGDKAVFLYDMISRKETARIPFPTAASGGGGNILLFSPDGKHVVINTYDWNGLHLIGLAERRVIRTFPHTDVVFAAAFSPDGKHLVGGGYDVENKVYFARRWEVDTGRELARLPFGKYPIRSVAYSPDGATMAIGGDYGHPASVKLVEAATGRERLNIPFPDVESIRSLAFSPDGKTLAAASDGPSIRLFDTATGKERLKIDREAIGLCFSPDGATLVGAVAATIDRWDATTGKSLIPEGGNSTIDQIAVTADGNRIVTRGWNGDAHIWDARTGAHQRRLGLGRFALSPVGRFLVWPVGDETIQFKDADDPKVTHQGSRLRMIDVASGRPVERFGGYEGYPHNLFFTDGGRTLVTVDHGRRDAVVRLWDVATGRVARSFPARGPGAPCNVWSSRLSPDGRLLAVRYLEQPVSAQVGRDVMRFWDIASGKELGEPPPLWFGDDVIAVSPDGKTVAVAGYDRTIQVRDAATGRVLGQIGGLSERATALAIGPDGRLYSGSLDGTVLAWDPRAAKPPANPQ